MFLSEYRKRKISKKENQIYLKKHIREIKNIRIKFRLI